MNGTFLIIRTKDGMQIKDYESFEEANAEVSNLKKRADLSGTTKITTFICAVAKVDEFTVKP